ncbi:hypothetical protein Mapa_009736 [Marchantia paleacea]|nr:hypothetical protein Mapa_009736 [Marchantia paleacea]
MQLAACDSVNVYNTAPASWLQMMSEYIALIRCRVKLISSFLKDSFGHMQLAAGSLRLCECLQYHSFFLVTDNVRIHRTHTLPSEIDFFFSEGFFRPHAAGSWRLCECLQYHSCFLVTTHHRVICKLG